MNSKVVLILLALGVVATAQAGMISRFETSLNSGNGRLGIYGGKSSTIDKHPYVASVVYEGSQQTCAATIISKKWVLLIADCIYGLDLSKFAIVSGSNDGVTGTNHTISKGVVHPSYNISEPIANNIAVVKINGSFKWNKKTKAVKLPKKEIAVNTEMSVAGYGDTAEGDNAAASNKLQQGQMKWLSTDKCNSMVSFVTFSDILACAYNKGKTTLCYGDWADALVYKGTVYGLYVGGLAKGYCTATASPGVFTDVYPFTGWIKKITGITY